MSDTLSHDSTTSRDTGLLVRVLGTPRPQPRPRFVRGRVSPVGTANKPAKLWRAAVRRAALEAVEAVGAEAVTAMLGRAVVVVIRVTFQTRERERWGKPHTAKPDGDNVAKLILDAMQEVGALGGDDSRVASLTVVKTWGEAGCALVCVLGNGEAPADTLDTGADWLRQ